MSEEDAVGGPLCVIVPGDQLLFGIIGTIDDDRRVKITGIDRVRIEEIDIVPGLFRPDASKHIRELALVFTCK